MTRRDASLLLALGAAVAGILGASDLIYLVDSVLLAVGAVLVRKL